MAIFYSPDIKETLTLDEEESAHAVKVLRKEAGDELEVVDGRGTLYHCRLKQAHKSHASVEIVSAEEGYEKREYYIRLAIAPTKNMDRIEWFAEKATEIGVDEIVPIICEHSERRAVKTERIEKILVSAMKQSKKAELPRLSEPMTAKEFLAKEYGGQKFICHCAEGDRRIFSKEIKPREEITVMVGPEGDFSAEEVAVAMERGFVPVSLGKARLRTETAGVCAVHTVAIINELNI